MKVRRLWSSIVQTLRDHGCQPRLLHPAKLSITIDGQNKIFHDRTRFNQYLATNLALHKRSYLHLQKHRQQMISQEQIPKKGETHKITSSTTKTKITGTINHWSLKSLHISGLNSPIKKHMLRDQIQKQNPSFCCIQETDLNLKDRHYILVPKYKELENLIFKTTQERGSFCQKLSQQRQLFPGEHILRSH